MIAAADTDVPRSARELSQKNVVSARLGVFAVVFYRRLGRQDLDAHVAAEPTVAGAIDLAHAARTDESEDLVGNGRRCRPIKDKQAAQINTLRLAHRGPFQAH